jgi:hypothetical protein
VNRFIDKCLLQMCKMCYELMQVSCYKWSMNNSNKSSVHSL